MAVETYYKGDDIVLDLTFLDANGDPIPPSSLSDYKAELRSSCTSLSVVKEFLKADFEVISDPLGETRIRIDRSETVDYAPSTYMLYVYLYAPDVDGEAGQRLEIVKTTPFKIDQF